MGVDLHASAFGKLVPVKEQSISEFIAALPKAELHLHLEGSVDPATLSELSRRHNTPLPATENNYGHNPDSGKELSEDDVRQLYRYQDFNGFLMAFKAVTERLRTPEDYELITYRLMQKLKSQNVVHAEVYVSVGVIHWRGQSFEHIFEGLDRGRERGERDFGVKLYWIFDAVRHFGAEAAAKVFDQAARLRDRHVIGIGIGGDENRGPAVWFRDLYAKAADHGLRLTCHAGESAGPESIWSALRDLKAERIGHGLTAIQDPKLMDYLAEHQIPVEICLSSNVRTGCCASLQEHPLPTYIDRGMLVTLNTDDPEMFETTLNREYELAAEMFGLSTEALKNLTKSSMKAAFRLI
ncbi:MAG TPA: adenosine deaminase [Terriglobales bacterium]|nr:adenosine deaminase [Terriglobales bacterium]